ncbi:MAG: flagellar basal body-associated FliL family protein [Paracoccaceae bacterium]
MIRKLLPVVLALAGLGAGIGAGLVLRPATEAAANDEHSAPEAESHDPGPKNAGEAPEFVKMNNQFVIPVVDAGRVISLVILSLSLQVPAGDADAVYKREPKLRDALLQVMFDHANAGGFRGTFTETATMDALRRALLEAAQAVLGKAGVSDVLIVDIVRQDS